LARDPARLLLWLGFRLVVSEIGIVVGVRAPGAIGVAVTAAGVAVLLYVILLSLHVLSLRLEVHPGEVRVTSILVRRRYRLVRGAVTRLPAPRGRALFGTQLGSFGLEIGLGTAGPDESVDVIRLAPVTSMIMIPSDGNRLAVAPSSERRLLRALGTAAAAIGLATSAGEAQSPVAPASR
jgi:uncharacterized membrane protein YtjA (UPF0391 family)